MTVYQASWTQRFTHPFTGVKGEHRLTQHVDGEQLDLLRDDPMVLDLRGFEAIATAQLTPDDLRWLHGHIRPFTGPRCGRTGLEELAADAVRLQSPTEGGAQVQDNPIERRQAFAQHLALFALATAGQSGTALERAKSVATR